MKIYLLGICGTFMAGVALLARARGFEVSGSDAGIYPPMSTQLEHAGIRVDSGYSTESLGDDIDLFIIGNAITRGNPQFESILNDNRPYRSGPQWLYEEILSTRWVLAVAGTHGKTTTTSMLAWILQYNGFNPGYLIGGVSQNLDQSAHLGEDPFFVIEADEYDTALFDKRSKFMHYHPRTLILNNLEFDHADIFADLAAIQQQFHHLVRSLPGNSLIIHNQDPALRQVLDMGCWSKCLAFSNQKTTSGFSLNDQRQLLDHETGKSYRLHLQQKGDFNALNACAALLAARHAGIPLPAALQALEQFQGVKRRQQLLAEIDGIRIIDDFAHHPTAIRLTLQALKPETSGRLFAVVDIHSNTLQMGLQNAQLSQSFAAADILLLCENSALGWNIRAIAPPAPTLRIIKPGIQHIIEYLQEQCQDGDQIVIMSNRSFDNIGPRLIQAMQSK